MCTQLDMHKFGHQHSPWGPSCCCYLSCLVSLSSWSLPAESWTCEKFYEHHESCSLCLACRLNMGSLQKKLVNVGILFEGGGLTHSQLLKTKSTTIQNSDFVAIWRGFPSPNQTNHQKSHQKSPKITSNHQKSHQNHQSPMLQTSLHHMVLK